MPRSLSHSIRIALLFVSTAHLFVSQAAAQAPQAGNYSPINYGVIGELNHDAPMRDGIVLKVDIFRPEAEGRFPVVLQVTPYNKDGRAVRAKLFAARGYVVINADSRGRFESGGEWDPFSPNPNTAEANIALVTEFQTAKQTIYHDATRPSNVVLPVIPAGK